MPPGGVYNPREVQRTTKFGVELMTEVQGGEMTPLSFPPHPPRGLPVALTAPEGLTAEKAAVLWPILLEVSIHIL